MARWGLLSETNRKRCVAAPDDVSLIRSVLSATTTATLYCRSAAPVSRRLRAMSHLVETSSLVGEINRIANSIASDIIEPASSLLTGFVRRRFIA